MKGKRFSLSRYGANRFEIVDDHARPFARQYEIFDGTLAEAKKRLAFLNNKGERVTKKRKSTKKPSAKQLAARKRFAAAARAGTLRKGAKLSKRKGVTRKKKKAAPRKKSRTIKLITRNPVDHEYRVVCEKNKKRYYYTGSTWLTNKSKAKLFATKRAAEVVGRAFARKYPSFSFGVLTN